MRTENYTIQLRKKFIGRKEIAKDELYHFLKGANPNLKPASCDKKIYEWKKTGILKEILSGVFQLESREKTDYTPSISSAIQKLNRIIKKEFPLIDYCIWETKWLSNFMLHIIPETNLIIIEAGNDAMEFVFNHFLANLKGNVFLNPGLMELYQKVWNSKESIIIKNLVSRAPLKKTDQLSMPRLEKILVDLFCDTDLFAPFQETESDQIFNYADEFYIISWRTAAHYAGRRGKTKEFVEYLQELKIIPAATVTKP